MHLLGFRKGAARALITACIFVSGSQILAQSGPATERIRAVIADLRSAPQAHEVDLALGAIPGVRMSRTDFNTRNLLMEVTADCGIDRAQVEALLLPHGLSLSCWKRGPQGALDTGLLDPRTCAEPPIER